MLDLIVAEYDITSSFWDLISCFYMRSMEVESAFCVPYTEFRKGSIVGTVFPATADSELYWADIRTRNIIHVKVPRV
jgi:hypothetical protein